MRALVLDTIQVWEQIDAYNPEFVVLAKYMRILSPAFVDRYPMRIVNIHHSFLPAFIGANPYKYGCLSVPALCLLSAERVLVRVAACRRCLSDLLSVEKGSESINALMIRP